MRMIPLPLMFVLAAAFAAVRVQAEGDDLPPPTEETPAAATAAPAPEPQARPMQVFPRLGTGGTRRRHPGPKREPLDEDPGELAVMQANQDIRAAQEAAARDAKAATTNTPPPAGYEEDPRDPATIPWRTDREPIPEGYFGRFGTIVRRNVGGRAGINEVRCIGANAPERDCRVSQGFAYIQEHCCPGGSVQTCSGGYVGATVVGDCDPARGRAKRFARPEKLGVKEVRFIPGFNGNSGDPAEKQARPIGNLCEMELGFYTAPSMGGADPNNPIARRRNGSFQLHVGPEGFTYFWATAWRQPCVQE